MTNMEKCVKCKVNDIFSTKMKLCRACQSRSWREKNPDKVKADQEKRRKIEGNIYYCWKTALPKLTQYIIRRDIARAITWSEQITKSLKDVQEIIKGD